jgi:hypothetical protein
MWTDLYRIVVALFVGLLAFAPAAPGVTEAQERPGEKQEASHAAHSDHQHYQQTPAQWFDLNHVKPQAPERYAPDNHIEGSSSGHYSWIADVR